jgi:N-acetylmuramidase
MSTLKFQGWMNSKGAKLVTDGQFGPKSQATMLSMFTTVNPTKITDTQIRVLAERLGVTSKQVAAVAAVESSGGGFEVTGKPKILFERHFFHRITNGKFDAVNPNVSNSEPGGYGPSSTQWDRLVDACKLDADAAFRSCSWGKFQVMGDWYDEFGFPTPWDMAYQCRGSEEGHYGLLASYVVMAKLNRAMAALSTNPVTCRAFASGYNGKGYAKNAYDIKLAKAMA